MKFNAFFLKKLNNFNLNVTINTECSNIITIFGESGSGKTTLLKCIAGLIKPEKSFLKINEKIYQDSKKNNFTPPNKRKIGYINQTPYLFPHLSVLQNILFGLTNKNQYINVNTLINILNLKKILKRDINNLSGGEKQRILISQVLLTQPKIIILDEPLSAQDINMKKNLILFIKKISNKFKIPIIWVSHNITELRMLSDNLIYLNKGKIIYSNI